MFTVTPPHKILDFNCRPSHPPGYHVHLFILSPCPCILIEGRKVHIVLSVNSLTTKIYNKHQSSGPSLCFFFLFKKIFLQ